MVGVSNRLLAATLIASSSMSASSVRSANLQDDTGPSLALAKSRAPQIFNAVHDSMRQWGASVHHNGMSFFLATVPQGVVLHHGNNREASPTEPDWLAYEFEHAEGFARGGRGPPGGPGGPGGGPGGPGYGPPGDDGPPGGGGPLRQGFHWDAAQQQQQQQPLQQHELRRRHVDTSASSQETSTGGWLHTYLATRPLHYLYIDGMSAGKTDMGTLDSQDYLLRHKARDNDNDGGPGSNPMWDERNRARQLCALCREWGLDGVIRMEAGFEIIQCDFANGLHELQALQRPPPSSGAGGPGGGRGGGGGPPGRGGLGSFEFVRGLAERYHDIGAARTRVDYASMVSAYFFGVNVTNPDPARPDLARLVNNSDAALEPIRAFLNQTLRERLATPVLRAVDWRDVTDLVVGRYADRLLYMADKIQTPSRLLAELNVLLTAFLDYSGQDGNGDNDDDDDAGRIPAAIDRCAHVYLHAIEPETEADTLILAALQTVTTEICTRLYQVRALAATTTNNTTTDVGSASGNSDDGDDDGHSADVMAEAGAMLQALMAYLGWARFKRCPACDVDEVCFIPMWPMGSKAAYESPRCVDPDHMDEGESYWGHGPGFGGGGPGRGRPGEGRDGKDGGRM